MERTPRPRPAPGLPWWDRVAIDAATWWEYEIAQPLTARSPWLPRVLAGLVWLIAGLAAAALIGPGGRW